MDSVFADLPEAEERSLFDIIVELRSVFVKKFPLIDLEVAGDESEAVFKSGNILLEVLSEIIINAAENSKFDTGIVLKWHEDEEGFTFEIENDSENDFFEGIDLEDPKPFRTGKGRHDGLGLAIIDRLINSIGGSFSLEVNDDKANAAKIYIPGKELK